MYYILKESQPTKTKCDAPVVFVLVDLAPPIGQKVFAASM